MTYHCDTSTLSDWKLERYRLKELPKTEMDAITKTLETDIDLQSRLAALNTSDAEIHALYPSERMVRQIEARASNTVSGPSRWIMPTLALAATILLAVAISLWVPGPEIQLLDGADPSQLQETTRIKGDARLSLYRKLDNQIEKLANGSMAHEGDRIQIHYLAGTMTYGTILSVDGNGVVTQHLPDLGTQSAKLTQGDPVALDFSYELDNAPKWERFYFVTSNATFDIAPIKEAVKTGADSLQLDNMLNQYAFTLYKGTTP